MAGACHAAFDGSLVTFDEAGQPRVFPHLSPAAQAELRWQEPIRPGTVNTGLVRVGKMVPGTTEPS